MNYIRNSEIFFTYLMLIIIKIYTYMNRHTQIFFTKRSIIHLVNYKKFINKQYHFFTK